jgi:hypothetical protein
MTSNDRCGSCNLFLNGSNLSAVAADLLLGTCCISASFKSKVSNGVLLASSPGIFLLAPSPGIFAN